MTGVIAQMGKHAELSLRIIQYSQYTFFVLSYYQFVGQGIQLWLFFDCFITVTCI
jgi:hypothetical protein